MMTMVLMSVPLPLLPVWIIVVVTVLTTTGINIRAVAATTSPRYTPSSSGSNTNIRKSASSLVVPRRRPPPPIVVKLDDEETTAALTSSASTSSRQDDNCVNHDTDNNDTDNDEDFLLDLIQMTGILDDPFSSSHPQRPLLASASAVHNHKQASMFVQQALQRNPIIEQYQPQPRWLWSQFAGTLLQTAWPTAVKNMVWAAGFCFLVRYATHGDCHVEKEALETSATVFPLVARLAVVDRIWTVLVGLTTFLLTFFVTQAYGFWKDFYTVTRSIQGRLNTIQMLLASHAAREINKTKKQKQKLTPSFPNKNHHHPRRYYGYTKDSLEFLQHIARRLRLFHLLHWSSQTRRFQTLLGDKGLKRLVETGVLTHEEKLAMDALDLPRTQRHYAILQATIADCQRALHNSSSSSSVIGVETKFLEQLLLSEFAQLRGKCASIPDLIDGRMPLAYAHFVQILVDTFVVCTPIAKYDSLGIYSVLMTGILSFFYQGLLMLAQVFLDPLDNEDYCDGCLTYDLSVLLRESNTASAKWIYGGAAL